MKRRKFLSISTPLAFTPFVMNGTSFRPFTNTEILNELGCADVRDRAMVLIRISGGNDGINTVIPINQYDAYKKLRPKIAIADTGTSSFIRLDSTLKAADQVGLHPGMTAFKSLYDKGKLNIVQGVGYINHNRSHFKSTDLLLTGGDGTASNFNIPSGWMGRYLDAVFPNLAGNPNATMPDPLGIQLGDANPSLGFHTEDEHATAINLSGQDPAGFYSLISEIGGQPLVDLPKSEYGEELQYIMDVEKATNKYAKRVSEVFAKGKNIGTYPNIDLANQLKTIARLISGGSKTKIYMVTIGGFDTHNNQVMAGSTSLGTHNNLLTNLANAIQAFQDDLEKLGIEEKVATVTFSEFGRKVSENDSFGTDHGNFAPMFVIGKGIKAGVTGTNVNLSDLATGDQLKLQQHDYRQVFATVLQDWLGADNAVLRTTLFDKFASQKLPLFAAKYMVEAACYTSAVATPTQDELLEEAGYVLKVYPNPAPANQDAYMTLESPFNYSGTASIIGITGSVLRRRPVQVVTGYNEFSLNIQGLSPGVYLVRLDAGVLKFPQTGKLVIQR
jgi:uncharacterized protein (DUF1501 family)